MEFLFFDEPEQEQEAKSSRGRGRPTLDLPQAACGSVMAEAYTEAEAAEAIGVSRQTLRNYRVGYRNATGTYPPKLTEGREWYKLRQSKRAPVLFSAEWVERMMQLKLMKEEVL